jgi:hypothetical protein
MGKEGHASTSWPDFQQLATGSITEVPGLPPCLVEVLLEGAAAGSTTRALRLKGSWVRTQLLLPCMDDDAGAAAEDRQLGEGGEGQGGRPPASASASSVVFLFAGGLYMQGLEDLGTSFTARWNKDKI